MIVCMTLFERARQFFEAAQEVAKVIFVLIMALVCVGLWAWAVVAIWPAGFFDTPFAAMTFGMLLRALGSVLVAIVAPILAFMLLFDI